MSQFREKNVSDNLNDPLYETKKFNGPDSVENNRKQSVKQDRPSVTNITLRKKSAE